MIILKNKNNKSDNLNRFINYYFKYMLINKLSYK